VVGPDTPVAGAYPVDPTLEDAFLYTLNFSAAAAGEPTA